MKEILKQFFEVSCPEVTQHLLPGTRVMVVVGDDNYVLQIDDERKVEVDKASDEQCDMEIRGNNEVMIDLLSSPDRKTLFSRMGTHIRTGNYPRVKILLERTFENAHYFQRGYYHFLREMSLLK